MLKLQLEKWSLSAHKLQHLALNAVHPRSRERFLALYHIALGSCPTIAAPQFNRDSQTLMKWVHLFNKKGPDALHYRKTGGRPPLASKL